VSLDDELQKAAGAGMGLCFMFLLQRGCLPLCESFTLSMWEPHFHRGMSHRRQRCFFPMSAEPSPKIRVLFEVTVRSGMDVQPHHGNN